MSHILEVHCYISTFEMFAMRKGIKDMIIRVGDGGCYCLYVDHCFTMHLTGGSKMREKLVDREPSGHPIN